MSDIEKYKESISEKIALIDHNDDNLSFIEKQIAKAGINYLIKDISRDTLVSEMSEIVKYIFTDIGLQSTPEKYNIIRFIDILNKYYRNLTIQEVKLAFELAAVGELDEFLPKDKNGNPDKNHYQQFSVDYVTKILNAYRKTRGKAWLGVKALPAPVVTEAQKKVFRTAFVTGIIDSFNRFKKSGKIDIFLIVRAAEFLIESGLIEELENLNKEEAAETLKIYEDRDKSIYSMKLVNIEHSILSQQMEPIEYRLRAFKTINIYFIHLIQTNQNLEELL